MLYKLTDITYKFLEPKELEDPTECVITARLSDGSQLHYRLVGMQLNPNYLNTSSLGNLLEQFLKENKVTNYEKILEDFVFRFDRDYISKAKTALVTTKPLGIYNQISYGVYHTTLNVYLDVDGYHYPIYYLNHFNYETLQEATEVAHYLAEQQYSLNSLKIHKLEKSIKAVQVFDVT